MEPIRAISQKASTPSTGGRADAPADAAAWRRAVAAAAPVAAVSAPTPATAAFPGPLRAIADNIREIARQAAAQTAREDVPVPLAVRVANVQSANAARTISPHEVIVALASALAGSPHKP